VWETEDTLRTAIQVRGKNGLAGVWGAADGPKARQLLMLRPGERLLLTKEARYNWSVLARCVRSASQNAYLTLVAPARSSRSRAICKHAEAMRARLKARVPDT
jgi:hypothetical protein